MKELEGKTIKNVLIHTDKTYIAFQDSTGAITAYNAIGDCCSQSWIEHFSGINNLIDATISKVEDIDLSALNPNTDDDYECIQVYGYKFTTDKGYVDFEYRNSSNGYYGGYMELDNDGSHHEIELKFLTEDF